MPIFSINLTRLFKQAITYVVLASLQLGTLTQVTQAYAQNVPQMAQLGAPSSAPFSGYNPDGTLYMGGQRIGNPHQVLHDAQIPAFMTITANRYTYSADPTHGQGTLAQMELATTNGSTSSVLLNRLYLSPNNPYATTQPLGQVWPYPNYQTYQGVLLNSQQAGYLGTTAQDGKDYLFKTLTAASSQAFTILIKELPNTPQFRAAADPAGGGVGVRVEQNGDAAALANYYKTVQPYDFTWRPNAGLYTGIGNGSVSGSGQNGQLDPMYSGWANSPGGAYSGANYAEGGGAPQSFNDFIKQQQAEALANDKRVRSQTTANSLDLSNTNVNTLFGEGYNLFDYGNQANPNLAAENEYLRKLQNGEFNAGSADYNEASRIAQERYRIAYATRLETNKPLQYSVADSQRKANELNLLDTNPNKLFGDGYDLFKYDPLTNPNGAAENALLTRLQSGQLTPGTPEYDEAKSIAQQRYRNAYSNSLAFNIAPKFTVAEAQRKANDIDLSQVNPNELFGQGFDLFQYNPALRPNGEAENALLAKLQNGELTVGSPEYLEATQIAQQRLRDAYSISLAPPEPKKIPKWKMIAGAVVGAIVTFVSAGTLGPLVGTAMAGVLGGAAGTLVSTTIITGSLSKGLDAAGRSLISGITKGSLKAIVTGIITTAFGIDLAALEGVSLSLANIAIDSLSSAATESILYGGSFGNNLQHAVVNSIVDEIAKGAANKIGDAFPNLDGTNLANYAAHGVLGCASAAAKGADCAAGAIGAMTGEVAAATGFLDAAANSTIGRTLNKDEIVFFGGLVGGTAAAVASKAEDVNANFATGTATASNAVENNYLKSNQLRELTRDFNQCKRQPGGCSQKAIDEIEKKYVELSEKNDAALAACKTSECIQKHRAEITKAKEYDDILDELDGRKSGELRGRQAKEAALAHQEKVVVQLEQKQKEIQTYIAANCQGMSTTACDAKLASSQEFTNTVVDIAAGFTPLGIGLDIRDFIKDPSLISAVAVVAGPVADVYKGIKGVGKVADARGGMNLAHVEVDVTKATKGSPEYNILNAPPPNSQVKLSNGTEFKTNSNGYVDEITYNPSLNKEVRDARQTAAGKEGLPTDVGGHIQACSLGGTCDRFNLFPQDKNFNNSLYKKWENDIKGALNNRDQVGTVTVRFNRTDPSSARPDSLVIDYSVNGTKIRKSFTNEAIQ